MPFETSVPNQDARPDLSRETLPDLGSTALPPGVAPARHIVTGQVVLAGDGLSACTHQSPPSGNGDRWCAFKRPVTGAGTELWVINVTRAVAGSAGTIVACDGGSADCLRLSTSLWTLSPLAGPQQRFANRFEGDTLFFHDQAGSVGEEAFMGAISVWRPGWPRARQLSTTANACYGDVRHPVAFCLDAVQHEGFIPAEFDLRAGSVASADGGNLPLVERVRLLRADGEPSVHATFTGDGAWFVYSAPASRTSPTAGLRLLKLEQIGIAPAREILPDVMDWELSKDGGALYYITEYADRGGKLTVVDFPSATNPRSLPYRVNGYVVLGGDTRTDKGLGIFVPLPGGGVEYRIAPDRAALDRQVKVFGFRSGLDAFGTSSDQRYTGYTKPENGERGFVARNDGSGECMLSPQRGRPPYDYGFLDGGGLVFWVEAADSDPDNQFDGWMADPATCTGRRRFADRIVFHQPFGDAGLLFADEFPGTADGAAVLKYAAITDGRTWPTAGPVRIHPGIDFPVTLLGPDKRALVFQVSRGPEPGRGLFVFGPLPPTPP